MDSQALISLAEQLAAGALSPQEFAEHASRILGNGPEKSAGTTARLSTTTLDLDRRRRCGFPEVIFGEGKTLAALEEIFTALLARGEPVFATRISPDTAAELLANFPNARYNEVARTFHASQGAWGRASGEP